MEGPGRVLPMRVRTRYRSVPGVIRRAISGANASSSATAVHAYRDDGGGAAGESIGRAAPVSHRLTAQQATEPQESISQFLHTFLSDGRCR
jgi:hypothetical protein